MITKRFFVFYNSHRYRDMSDNPTARQRIVKAETAEHAMEIMQTFRDIEQDSCYPTFGKTFIGMIHVAEEIVNPKG